MRLRHPDALTRPARSASVVVMRSFSSRSFQLTVFGGAASIALYGSASCGDHHGEGGTVNSAIADVVFEGETNDEALEALLAVTPPANPPKFAAFTQPSDGAALPSASIPTFSWEMKNASTGRAPLPPPAARWASLGGLSAEPARDTEWDRRALFGPLLELIGPERAASAHGAPVNGTAYFVLFSTSRNEKLLRVFTSKTSYTPDDTAWGKLKSAGEPISAWILTGVFDSNDVASDGGPFRGPWISFTVKP